MSVQHADELLLLLGSGDPNYRGYAMQSLADKYSVLLVDSGPFSWQSDHAQFTLEGQPQKPDSVISVLKSFDRQISGMLTYDEFCVESAAFVAKKLGLRQNPPEVARRCRNKQLMREALERSGVPSADSIPVRSLDEARAAARTLGYPVVLKPNALAGSIGVIRVDRVDELAERYEFSRSSGHGAYGISTGVTLVEEYLDGPEVSVESVVREGVAEIFAVTRKTLGPAPFFEEIGHVVAPKEPLSEHDRICEVTEAAHRALGVRWGATHTELRLTDRGPKMIELAVRLAGDLIPLLVRLATGVDLVAAAAAALIVREHPPAPCAESRSAAAVGFFYPPHDLEFESVELTDEVETRPWLHRFCHEVTPGQQLRLPPRGYLNRIGYAIVTGDTVRECEQRIDEVACSLKVTGNRLY